LKFNELNLNVEKIRSIAGFSNLSDEEINAVLNFLVEIAKLEITIQETNKI
jgi:hypothetical protein